MIMLLGIVVVGGFILFEMGRDQGASAVASNPSVAGNASPIDQGASVSESKTANVSNSIPKPTDSGTPSENKGAENPARVENQTPVSVKPISKKDWLGADLPDLPLPKPSDFDEEGILTLERIKHHLGEQIEKYSEPIGARDEKTRPPEGPARSIEVPQDLAPQKSNGQYSFSIGMTQKYDILITAANGGDQQKAFTYNGNIKYIVIGESDHPAVDDDTTRVLNEIQACMAFPVTTNGYFIAPLMPIVNQKFVKIAWDDAVLNGEVVAADPTRNLALIKVNGDDFPVLAFQDVPAAEPNQSVFCGIFYRGIARHSVWENRILGKQVLGSGIELLTIQNQLNYGAHGGVILDESGRLLGITMFNPNWVEPGLNVPVVLSATTIREFLAANGIPEVATTGKASVEDNGHFQIVDACTGRILNVVPQTSDKKKWNFVDFDGDGRVERQRDQILYIPSLTDRTIQSGAMSIDDLGHIGGVSDATFGDAFLPFVLGRLISVPFVEFPEQNRNSWQDEQKGTLVIETPSRSPFRSRFSRFNEEIRIPSLRTDNYQYQSETDRETTYRLTRKYQTENEGAPLLSYTLDGTVSFDKQTGWLEIEQLNGTFQVNADSESSSVPLVVTIKRTPDWPSPNDLAAINAEKVKAVQKIYYPEFKELTYLNKAYESKKMDWLSSLSSIESELKYARHRTSEKEKVLELIDRIRKAQEQGLKSNSDQKYMFEIWASWCNPEDIPTLYEEMNQFLPQKFDRQAIVKIIGERRDAESVAVLLKELKRDAEEKGHSTEIDESLASWGEVIEPVILDQLHGCKSPEFAKRILDVLKKIAGPRAAKFLRNHGKASGLFDEHELNFSYRLIETIREQTSYKN